MPVSSRISRRMAEKGAGFVALVALVALVSIVSVVSVVSRSRSKKPPMTW